MRDSDCSPTASHSSHDKNWVTDAAWIVTAVCSALATVLTIKLIYNHLTSFHKPNQQKHIIRILVMVPIYAIDSWLSFRFYWLSVYFDLIRDCYEAVVIYEFYALLVEYSGGYEKTKDAFEKRDPFKLVVPLCCWQVHPRRGLLRWLSRLTLQYVIFNPLTAVISIGLQAAGSYCDGELTNFSSGYPYISAITFVSVTVAMYALILFYVVAKEELKPYNPVPKFLSIKFIIMLSFWQSIVVAGLVKINVITDTATWSSDNISAGVQNALICFEMLIISIWHLFAFKYQEFAAPGAPRTSIRYGLSKAFRYSDVWREMYASFFSIAVNAFRKEDEEVLFQDPDETPNKTTPLYEKTQAPFASAIVV